MQRQREDSSLKNDSDCRNSHFFPLTWGFKFLATQSTNQDVYNGTVKDLVTGVLHGINATVFAYGSTGSGKTWTMVGESSVMSCFEHVSAAMLLKAKVGVQALA